MGDGFIRTSAVTMALVTISISISINVRPLSRNKLAVWSKIAFQLLEKDEN